MTLMTQDAHYHKMLCWLLHYSYRIWDIEYVNLKMLKTNRVRRKLPSVKIDQHQTQRNRDRKQRNSGYFIVHIRKKYSC